MQSGLLFSQEILDIYLVLVRFFVFSAHQGFGDRVRGLLHQVTRLRQGVLDWFHGFCLKSDVHIRFIRIHKRQSAGRSVCMYRYMYMCIYRNT